MKKLALALVCFASLAFFASCVKEGQPTIQVLNAEGFVQDGATVNTGEEVDFGFVVASSAVTNSELSTLVVTVDGYEWANIDLTGETEYTYTDYVTYEPERDDILGTSVITAVVTDAAGQTATASITLTINQADEPLVSRTFSWVRRGTQLQSADEMAAVGLTWPGNYPREDFVRITPLTGCSMYIIENGDKFAEITTQSEKEAFFADLRENGTTADRYTEISAWAAERTYNTMLAVIDAAGEKHLIHITRSTVESAGSAGGLFTIYGELN